VWLPLLLCAGGQVWQGDSADICSTAGDVKGNQPSLVVYKQLFTTQGDFEFLVCDCDLPPYIKGAFLRAFAQGVPVEPQVGRCHCCCSTCRNIQQ
jgi:hypothetical protein